MEKRPFIETLPFMKTKMVSRVKKETERRAKATLHQIINVVFTCIRMVKEMFVDVDDSFALLDLIRIVCCTRTDTVFLFFLVPLTWSISVC